MLDRQTWVLPTAVIDFPAFSILKVISNKQDYRFKTENNGRADFPQLKRQGAP